MNPIQLNAVEKAYLLQPHRFQGQVYDSETGLHYNRFRYYDPDAGRFISHDPIGLMGGDNHFQYAPNPLHWIDVLGLSIDPCCKGKLVKLNPKDINFAQRSVNPNFDTPKGKIPMSSAVRLGLDQVANFPPISVINVKGQWVARDGNSRLAIAKQVKAPEIFAIDESSCKDKVQDLNKRLRNNNLPKTGTKELPRGSKK